MFTHAPQKSTLCFFLNEPYFLQVPGWISSSRVFWITHIIHSLDLFVSRCLETDWLFPLFSSNQSWPALLRILDNITTSHNMQVIIPYSLNVFFAECLWSAASISRLQPTTPAQLRLSSPTRLSSATLSATAVWTTAWIQSVSSAARRVSCWAIHLQSFSEWLSVKDDRVEVEENAAL